MCLSIPPHTVPQALSSSPLPFGRRWGILSAGEVQDDQMAPLGYGGPALPGSYRQHSRVVSDSLAHDTELCVGAFTLAEGTLDIT